MCTTHGLASELGPFSYLLCDKNLLAFLCMKESQRLWRALIANTIYWTVRREIGEQDRNDVLKAMINYSDANVTHPLPDDDEEPGNVVIHEELDGRNSQGIHE